MFELQLKQGGLLKIAMEAIKDFATVSKLDCDRRGLQFQAEDSSGRALVAIFLRADRCEHYHCDQKASMGINFSKVGEMFKFAQEDDVISISKNVFDGNSITFIFANPSHHKVSSFRMKLLNIGSVHIGIPEIDYDTTVCMPSEELARTFRCLSTVGDTVVISVTRKDNVHFSTSGSGEIEIASVNCFHSNDVRKEEGTVIDMKHSVSVTLSLQHVYSFFQGTSLSSTVTLHMTSTLPVQVEYRLANIGYVRFYLVPEVIEAKRKRALCLRDTQSPTTTSMVAVES